MSCRGSRSKPLAELEFASCGVAPGDNLFPRNNRYLQSAERLAFSGWS